MKKFIIALLGILLCLSSSEYVSARTTSNSELASAIKLYKAKNYSQSYTVFSNIVKKDPSNAVAYYYLAMSSAQIGKKEEAIENYQKTINLAPGGRLGFYATKGKTCIESPDKCSSGVSEEDSFIRGAFGSGFSQKVRSEYEKQKLENMMREMNRNDDISPEKFKEYRDFSSYSPSNDEIVSALRVLQQAGLTNVIGGNSSYSDLSLINGNNSLMGLLGNNNSQLNPQVIQALMTSQLSSGF